MKIATSLLAFLLLVTTTLFGQESLSGKTFIDEKLNQIDFLNDSILTASFMVGSNRYEFKNGKLNLQLPHKLLYWSSDTIQLAYKDILTRKRDTMLFVNIQKYIIKIENFDSLRLDTYGSWDPNRIIIRNDKTVLFSTDKDLPEKELVHYRYLLLSDEQYKQFLDTLTKCLIFMLPPHRHEGGFDMTYFDFAIHTNGRLVISEGDGLSKIHSKLVGYLMNEIPRIAKSFK
jgi:hypothetical protein